MERVFEALASTPRRQILAYLSGSEMTAGEIAERFSMTKPSLSKHLRILENAGLIVGEKRGQFVFYRMTGENLQSTLAAFLQTICPVSRALKVESRGRGKKS